MPALSPSTAPITPPSLDTTNATSSEIIQVVCAWPVSGQYGPGSRFLYYVLVAACVLGRSFSWLRGACLAAALLLPAVAALHGIVLAAVHVPGAVDMDIYGAFQLCAIGVLAGPVTVRLSRTYFNTPGRNLIFLWTGMILSGLLSLTVEFFRTNTVPCSADGFAYGEDMCGLTCSADEGPTSPLRGGAQNNIYVIKAPDALAFGAATLLAAACCIPAILSLASTWNKILKMNWKKRFGATTVQEDPHALNAVAEAKMLNVNEKIRFYLSMVEIPVFGAAVLAILIVGERNFFSDQVLYMSEPIASVGQWAPIVGTGLAALGSLYALLAADATEDKSKTSSSSSEAGIRRSCCNCSQHRPSTAVYPANTPSQDPDEEAVEIDQVETRAISFETTRRQSAAPRYPQRRLTAVTTGGTTPDRGLHRSSTMGTAGTADPGGRRKVRGAFERIGQMLGTPAPDAFDDSAFRVGPAADFPTVPGEVHRNAELPQIMASYNQPRDSEGQITPIPGGHRQHSRTGSFSGSVVSGLGVDGVSDAASHSSEPAAGPSVDRSTQRRPTLEVPKQVYHSPVLSKGASFT